MGDNGKKDNIRKTVNPQLINTPAQTLKAAEQFLDYANQPVAPPFSETEIQEALAVWLATTMLIERDFPQAFETDLENNPQEREKILNSIRQAESLDGITDIISKQVGNKFIAYIIVTRGLKILSIADLVIQKDQEEVKNKTAKDSATVVKIETGNNEVLYAALAVKQSE